MVCFTKKLEIMKKILLSIGAVAIAATMVFNTTLGITGNKAKMSALMLANVEALAKGEDDGPSGTCGAFYDCEGGWCSYKCGISKDEALALFASSTSGGGWCCDSCSSTGYCGDGE